MEALNLKPNQEQKLAIIKRNLLIYSDRIEDIDDSFFTTRPTTVEQRIQEIATLILELTLETNPFKKMLGSITKYRSVIATFYNLKGCGAKMLIKKKIKNNINGKLFSEKRGWSDYFYVNTDEIPFIPIDKLKNIQEPLVEENYFDFNSTFDSIKFTQGEKFFVLELEKPKHFKSPHRYPKKKLKEDAYENLLKQLKDKMITVEEILQGKPIPQDFEETVSKVVVYLPDLKDFLDLMPQTFNNIVEIKKFRVTAERLYNQTGNQQFLQIQNLLDKNIIEIRQKGYSINECKSL